MSVLYLASDDVALLSPSVRFVSLLWILGGLFVLALSGSRWLGAVPCFSVPSCGFVFFAVAAGPVALVWSGPLCAGSSLRGVLCFLPPLLRLVPGWLVGLALALVVISWLCVSWARGFLVFIDTVLAQVDRDPI